MSKAQATIPQFLIDAAQKAHPGHNPNNFRVGYKFRCPTIHPQFAAAVGAVYVEDKAPNYTVHVWDYSRYVDVSPEGNSFLKSLACGVIESLGLWNEIDRVVLHIARPGGLVRSWETDEESLCIWLEDVHIPALERAAAARAAKAAAAVSTATASGGNAVHLAAYRRGEPRPPAQP